MITDKQREERRLGIGGSDMPIILGLSQYKTPLQLYLEKKGIISDDHEVSLNQKIGNALEPICRDEFADRNNVLIETPETIIHPFYHFMRGNIDGYIPQWNHILEAKSTSAKMDEWGEEGSDVIPMYYLVQVAHYCFIMNVEVAHIALLFVGYRGGYQYRQYKYVRDLELEKILFAAAHSFWNCIENDIMPSPVNQIDLRMIFPSHKPTKSINISFDISLHFKKLTDVKKKMKELQEIEKESQFVLMKHMEDAECLTDEEGNPLVTWKTNKKGSRTFLLKGEK